MARVLFQLSRRSTSLTEVKGKNMILYVFLLAFLIWSVYNGEVLPRVGAVIAATFIALNLVFFFMKLPLPYYIVTFAATTIYLVVKTYGGDVKIR